MKLHQPELEKSQQQRLSRETSHNLGCYRLIGERVPEIRFQPPLVYRIPRTRHPGFQYVAAYCYRRMANPVLTVRVALS